MKTTALLVIFLVGVATGAVLRQQAAHAQSYVQDSAAAPAISLTHAALAKFWSQQAGIRGVTNDAQWNTAMATLFATGTSPGMDPTALAFLRSYFVQIVHVGVP